MKKYLLLTLTVMLLLPVAASAQSVLDTLCELYDCVFSNGVVLAIATTAILFLGIGAFFGKVNWGMLFVAGTGMVVIAGAYGIAALLLPNATDPTGNCGNNTCDGLN